MGNEITTDDLDAEIDFSDETTRLLYARRLAPEISGEMFVEDPETTRGYTLDRDDAVDKLSRMYKRMYECDEKSIGTTSARGLLQNQRTFEAVAGRPLDEALTEAHAEYEELDIGRIGPWLLG